MQITSIRVRVPATTANLGPGFDCLAMALEIWNEVRVELQDETAVSVYGREGDNVRSDTGNLVYRSMQRVFELRSLKVPGLNLECHNEIPLKRGLGGSAAAIVGGLVAANFLVSRLAGPNSVPLSEWDLLKEAVRIEGHPDNVAAALFGGIRLVAEDEDDNSGLFSSPVSLPDGLHAVLFVPEMTIATEDARAVLPGNVSRGDAVYNVGKVAFLVNAMATGRLEDLRHATRDRLHQPYRKQLFPAMKVIFEAALDAGALGVFLSGSGSTILALTHGREMTVAYEMAEAARKATVEGEVKVTVPSPRGAHQVGNGDEGE